MDDVTLLRSPGSGKSTVTEFLTAQRGDVRAFRLREFTHQQARSDHTVVQALTDGRDLLGRLPGMVAVLLVWRSLERYVGDGGVLLMEGCQGTFFQARALVGDISRGGFGGRGIELTGPASEPRSAALRKPHPVPWVSQPCEWRAQPDQEGRAS